MFDKSLRGDDARRIIRRRKLHASSQPIPVDRAHTRHSSVSLNFFFDVLLRDVGDLGVPCFQSRVAPFDQPPHLLTERIHVERLGQQRHACGQAKGRMSGAGIVAGH